jgi:glycine cleavage system aminomethyltransferase T
MANVKVPSLTPSDPSLIHDEVLWQNGNRVSDIRMGSYGHSVGGGVGLTMLQAADTDIITSSWVEDATASCGKVLSLPSLSFTIL